MIDEAAVTAAIAGLDVPLLHGAALSLTALGSVSVTLVLIAVLYRGGHRMSGYQVLLTAGIGGSVTVALKYLIARPRPDLATVSTVTPSFPSGHATLAFGTAVVLADRFERLRPIFLSLAVLIAGTRLVLGVHHPSDILAGAIIGTAAGTLVLRYGDRILPES